MRIGAGADQFMNIYQLKGTSGSVINQSFPCGDGLLLGSSTECDVQLDGPGVAPRHAEISLPGNEGLLLMNLDPTFVTLLNGESVTEHMLGSGDEIRIGSCRLMLQAPGLRPQRVLTAVAVRCSSRRWLQPVLWVVLLASAAAWVLLEYLKT